MTQKLVLYMNDTEQSSCVITFDQLSSTPDPISILDFLGALKRAADKQNGFHIEMTDLSLKDYRGVIDNLVQERNGLIEQRGQEQDKRQLEIKF